MTTYTVTWTGTSAANYSITSQSPSNGTALFDFSSGYGLGNVKIAGYSLPAGFYTYTFNYNVNDAQLNYGGLGVCFIRSNLSYVSVILDPMTNGSRSGVTGTFTLSSTTTIYPGVGVVLYSTSRISAVWRDTYRSSTMSVVFTQLPSAPTIVSVNVGALDSYGYVHTTIVFNPPASSGGTITDYQYSIDGGTNYASVGSTTSPFILSNLPYTEGSNVVQIRAVNSAGPGDVSNSVIISGPTIGPTITSATINSSNALTIAYTPGSSDGGSSITVYQYSTDNGVYYTYYTDGDLTSPMYITDAFFYTTPVTVKIRSFNQTGFSPASNSVIITTAGAPTLTSATVNSSNALTISFTAPASNGGAAITNYQYSINGGSTYTDVSPSTTSSPFTITGLSYASSNSIKIRAVNAVGEGAASTASVIITTAGAPTLTSATVNSSNALIIAFTAPGSDGGAPITNYQYSINGGASYTAVTPSTTTSPLTIGGLSYASSNSIKIRAVNAAGGGAASTASVIITTAGAPTINLVTLANSTNVTATVTFTAPSSNGNAAITNYQYSTNNGSTYTTCSPASASSPLTITGLPFVTAFNIIIKAINATGIGAVSNTYYVAPTTGVPSAPTITAQNDAEAGQIFLSFTPPVSNGGLPITNYTYTITDINGGVTGTVICNPPTTTSPILVGGLGERTYYKMTLQAINIVGTGTASPMFYFRFMCFLEGTKILCYDSLLKQEIYRPIQTLRKGDLVKTYSSGYKAIDCIGTSKIYNPENSMRSSNRLYRCPQGNYPELFEDLVLTGCHSILVPDITDEERAELKEIQGKIYITENHYRLIARVDRRAIPYEQEGTFDIWHFALENDNYFYNYGVYANGLLVETSSKRMMNELSGMNLLQ